MNLPRNLKFPFRSAPGNINGLETACDASDIQNAITKNRRRTDGATGAKLPTSLGRRVSRTNSLPPGPSIVIKQRDPVSFNYGGLRVFRHFQLRGDPTMIDLLEIRNTQAQLPRCGDMSGSAIEQILARIMEKRVIVLCNALWITIPN